VLELQAKDVTAIVSPADGGRLASLEVHGTELLVSGGASDLPMLWGSFPMAPYAGRVRHGLFTFEGCEYQLPPALEGHAIHGTTYTRPWEVDDDGSLMIELGDDWPFGGHAVQRFAIDRQSLTCTIEVHAGDRPMPAQAGWHPWYRRPVELHFAARSMYERDSEGIPTGRLVAPTERPWDDCFTDLVQPTELVWADGPTVTITSSCEAVVVFDHFQHGLCVEPQTGPPDIFNLGAHVVVPGEPLVATMRLSWD
jgi:aldose 1-epimerase